LLGAIVLLLRMAGAADLSSAEAAKPTPDVGVQAATPPALLIAADRVAPRKLPCPYCPKKQKQSGCVAPCSAMPLAQASDMAPLIADMAPMAIRPPPLAGIARPPDPPPPKS
jgi:hypothetical protein